MKKAKKPSMPPPMAFSYTKANVPEVPSIVFTPGELVEVERALTGRAARVNLLEASPGSGPYPEGVELNGAMVKTAAALRVWLKALSGAWTAEIKAAWTEEKRDDVAGPG